MCHRAEERNLVTPDIQYVNVIAVRDGVQSHPKRLKLAKIGQNFLMNF